SQAPPAGSYTWASVNVTAGGYRLAASFHGVESLDTDIGVTVGNGTETSCLESGLQSSTSSRTSSAHPNHKSSRIHKIIVIIHRGAHSDHGRHTADFYIYQPRRYRRRHCGRACAPRRSAHRVPLRIPGRSPPCPPPTRRNPRARPPRRGFIAGGHTAEGRRSPA
ncbi:hypothetical protein DFH09DRAFT_1472587, partial [Mycena vulgaris]